MLQLPQLAPGSASSTWRLDARRVAQAEHRPRQPQPSSRQCLDRRRPRPATERPAQVPRRCLGCLSASAAEAAATYSRDDEAAEASPKLVGAGHVSGEAVLEEQLAADTAEETSARRNGSSTPANSEPARVPSTAGSTTVSSSINSVSDSPAADAADSQRESWWHSRHDRDIWGLAIPALFSILLEPFMGVVDTAIVGRLGAAQLGAVGLANMIFNFSNFLVWCLLIANALHTVGSVNIELPPTGLGVLRSSTL